MPQWPQCGCLYNHVCTLLFSIPQQKHVLACCVHGQKWENSAFCMAFKREELKRSLSNNGKNKMCCSSVWYETHIVVIVKVDPQNGNMGLRTSIRGVWISYRPYFSSITFGSSVCSKIAPMLLKIKQKSGTAYCDILNS